MVGINGGHEEFPRVKRSTLLTEKFNEKLVLTVAVLTGV